MCIRCWEITCVCAPLSTCPAQIALSMNAIPGNDYEQLKQENEKLKAEKEMYSDCAKRRAQTIIALGKRAKLFEEENQQLEAQLQEQKEIANVYKYGIELRQTEYSNLLGCDKDSVSIYNSIERLKAQLQSKFDVGMDLGKCDKSHTSEDVINCFACLPKWYASSEQRNKILVEKLNQQKRDEKPHVEYEQRKIQFMSNLSGRSCNRIILDDLEKSQDEHSARDRDSNELQKAPPNCFKCYDTGVQQAKAIMPHGLVQIGIKCLFCTNDKAEHCEVSGVKLDKAKCEKCTEDAYCFGCIHKMVLNGRNERKPHVCPRCEGAEFIFLSDSIHDRQLCSCALAGTIWEKK